MNMQPGQHQQSWFRTANDLSPQTRASSVELLNRSLADTTDLMTQLKYAHWNVKGRNFYQFHLLFDEIAEVLEQHADDIAERATELGGEATGTLRMAAATSRIPEMPERVVTGPEYVAALVERVAIHAANLRANIDAAMGYGDQDTADLYAEISRDIDKQLWFLEAHQQARGRTDTPQAAGQMGGTPDMGPTTGQNTQAATGDQPTAGGQSMAGEQSRGTRPVGGEQWTTGTEQTGGQQPTTQYPRYGEGPAP